VNNNMVFGSFGTALATMQPGVQHKQQHKSDHPVQSLAHAVAAAINSPAAGKVVPAAASEPGKVKLYSPEYYYTCGLGGILSCGLTHTAVTPLDVVKCNMQTNPAKYPSIGTGFSVVLKEQGAAGLMRGWLPTLLGYSAQGAFKFGLVRAVLHAFWDICKRSAVAALRGAARVLFVCARCMLR
jgi:solute carrier family 25 phosphate transporter 3